MRVLHAPVNIGNQPWVLSRNERKLGIESELIVLFRPPLFRYQADRALSANPGGRSEKELRARMNVGLRAALDYDVLHYYFGRTLFTWGDYADSPFLYLDLKLAKAAGRTVFFTLQGCDARLASESAKRNDFTPCRKDRCHFFETCVNELDKNRRAFIREILPLADRVFYLNPELGHYVPNAQFLPYSNVEISELEVLPPSTSGRVRIVHAPSDGAIKGTPAILAALESLRYKYDFELTLVENMPHEEAMKMYRRADLVIDQVLLGWYGGFAVEAMSMGKPVLCYLRPDDFEHVPRDMISDLPVRNIRPDRIAEDVADALDRRAEWPEWSVRSRRYVEKWHNPFIIATAMVAAYKNPTALFDLAPPCLTDG